MDILCVIIFGIKVFQFQINGKMNNIRILREMTVTKLKQWYKHLKKEWYQIKNFIIIHNLLVIVVGQLLCFYHIVELFHQDNGDISHGLQNKTIKWLLQCIYPLIILFLQNNGYMIQVYKIITVIQLLWY